MMCGATPGAVTALGSGKLSIGACGGLISTALMFWPNGCSTLAGTYPSPGLVGSAVAPRPVGAAPAGRVTAICTVVVRPMKTGSVPRGPDDSELSGPTPSGDIITGVAEADYNVPALAAGDYPFVCSVHPNMTGTLTAE